MCLTSSPLIQLSWRHSRPKWATKSLLELVKTNNYSIKINGVKFNPVQRLNDHSPPPHLVVLMWMKWRGRMRCPQWWCFVGGILGNRNIWRTDDITWKTKVCSSRAWWKHQYVMPNHIPKVTVSLVFSLLLFHETCLITLMGGPNTIHFDLPKVTTSIASSVKRPLFPGDRNKQVSL